MHYCDKEQIFRSPVAAASATLVCSIASAASLLPTRNAALMQPNAPGITFFLARVSLSRTW